MQRTEHYNLSKPERTDPFRAQDVADNLDAIDEAIHNAAESGTASVDGMDIRPASVTATGDVADATGTLDGVRQAAKDAGNITDGTLPIARGGTGAATAATARTNLGVTAANVVNGNAIAPSSVTATGAVSGSSVSDSVGSLADLRDSVSQAEWADASKGVYASKVGHIVILTLRTGGEVTLTPLKNSLTTLPSGWRPSRQCVSTATAGNDVYQLLTDPSGEVFVWSNYAETHSGYLRGNLVFCVA